MNIFFLSISTCMVVCILDRTEILLAEISIHLIMEHHLTAHTKMLLKLAKNSKILYFYGLKLFNLCSDKDNNPDFTINNENDLKKCHNFRDLLNFSSLIKRRITIFSQNVHGLKSKL